MMKLIQDQVHLEKHFKFILINHRFMIKYKKINLYINCLVIKTL